ncbi:MAG: nitroreductase family protein [Candidatus Aureabacteria bacterium]|nr:nitroreductase family protein [Candidatus Auribacterota bacterium]
MKFLDLVKARRSIRAYAPKPVGREVIDRCCEAARLAPSACNAQPWSFIVVDEPRLVAALAREAFSGIYSMNSFASQAGALIAVITERAAYSSRLGGFFRGTQYSLIDIGIACEHLVLQAQEEGLGSCWLGWFNERAVKRRLGLPRGSKVDILISLGYPAGDVEKREHARKPLNQIRRFCTAR